MFPHVHAVITWCAEQPEMTDVYVIDPVFIYDWDALSRMYYLKCRLLIPKLDKTGSLTIAQQAKKLQDENPDLTFVSSYSCEQVSTALKNPDLGYRDFNEFNREVICNAEQIVPQLYKVRDL